MKNLKQLILVPLAALSLSVSAQEVLLLDSYQDPDPSGDFTSPVFTASPLLAGQEYEVRLEGNVSNFTVGGWSTGTPCGAPDAAAAFPSPMGEMDGPTGSDALFYYAVPFSVCGALPSLPFLAGLTTWSLDGGVTFGFSGISVIPTYNPAHVYTFTLTGEGQIAAFRYEDLYTPDNHGQLRITITPIAAPPASPARPVPVFSVWMVLFSALGLLVLGARKVRLR